MEGIRISDLEKLREQGKHVHVNPDGTVTVADHPPRLTIDQVLAQDEREDRQKQNDFLRYTRCYCFKMHRSV